MEIPKPRMPERRAERPSWRQQIDVLRASLVVRKVGEAHRPVAEVVARFVNEPSVGGNAAEERTIGRVVLRCVSYSDEGVGRVVRVRVGHVSDIVADCFTGRT